MKLIISNVSGVPFRTDCFTLPKGYIMGLNGPNGSGKTTIIKLILNMLGCTGGTVKVLGLDNITEEQMFTVRGR